MIYSKLYFESEVDTMKSHQTILAYVLTILKTIIYGTSILFTGTLLRTTSVMDVLSIRFLISAFAFLLLAVTKIIRINFRGKTVKYLLATAIFEPLLYFLFETAGLQYTTTSLAGIICAMTPAMVVLFETLILKERTSLPQKLLLLLSIGGVILVSIFTNRNASGERSSLFGIILLLIAYASGALFCVFSRKSSQDFSSIEITFFTTMLGAISFNGINVVRHLSAGTITTYFAPLLQPENLTGFLFLGILSSIIATMMNNYALSRVQASSVCALGGIGTITSVVIGIVVNKEILYWYHIVGAVMILIGAIGVNYLTQRKSEK